MSPTAVSGPACRVAPAAAVTAGIGAAAVLGPDLTRAARVIAVDADERKPATVHRLGATHPVNSPETDTAYAVRKLPPDSAPAR
ncbi:hypothetical protein ABT075_32335 [Streptomyces sp. NPDC002677]|uniref:hypothetical protein n=1 Tax=Streptomyces sp. NPDC002677 TaxID=3154774 RepID=UPI003318B30C